MRHVHNLALATLVLGSLVFSVGGVAITGRADGANQSIAPTANASDPAPLEAKPAPQAQKDCHPPERHEVRAQVPKDDPSKTVVLNTRGYNYPMPNELRPLAPSRKDSRPPAAAEEAP
jgi:hypothetical protein